MSTINHVLTNINELNIHSIYVDEGSRITVLEYLAALQNCDQLQKIIVFGDSRQLGAMDAQGRDQRNAMEWLRYHRGVRILDMEIQYRFGEPLNRAIGSVFYKERMTTKKEKTIVNWIVV